MKKLCIRLMLVMLGGMQSFFVSAYTLRKHMYYRSPRTMGSLIPLSFDANRMHCKQIMLQKNDSINGYIDLKRKNGGDKALLHVQGVNTYANEAEIPIALAAAILQLSDFLYFITHIASSTRRSYIYLPQGNMPVITFKNMHGSGILQYGCAEDMRYFLGRMELESSAEFFGQKGTVRMVIDPSPSILSIQGSGQFTPIKTPCMQITNITLAYLYDLINTRNDHCTMTGMLTIPALRIIDHPMTFHFKHDRFLARFDTTCGACTLTWAIDFDPARPLDVLFDYAVGTDLGNFLTQLVAKKIGRNDIKVSLLRGVGSSTCKELQVRRAPVLRELIIEVEVSQQTKTQMVFKNIIFNCDKAEESFKSVVAHIIRFVKKI